MRHRQLARSRRRGFTMVELLFSLIILSVVTVAVIGVLQGQQRFYRGARELMEARRELRRGANAIAIDLRALAPTMGDVRAYTDTSVNFLTTTGASIVCTANPTLSRIGLPPQTLSLNNGLTSWLSQPAVGDTVAIYREGNQGAADDGYTFHLITGVTVSTAATACPVVSGFTVAADATRPALLLTISNYTAAINNASVIVGAPVRFFRRARYAFFRDATGAWYLGYSECPTNAALTATCNALEAVAGPFLPYSTDAAQTGLRFAFFDPNNTAMVPGVHPPANIARIEMLTRAASASNVTLSGASGTTRDSTFLRIGVRNR